MNVDLTGTAYSPINPSWTFGPMNITFDMTGGQPNGIVTDGATVSDFQLSFSQGHFDFPAATANYYFTPTHSGIAVFGPDDFTFVWNSDGTGGFQDSEEKVYTNFYQASFSHSDKWVTTPEPGAASLLVPGLVLLWFWFRVFSSRQTFR